MKLIGARNHRGTEQGQDGIQKKTGLGQAHPQRAQPQQSHGSVADEVSSLANVMMQNLPPLVGDLTDNVLPDPAERAAGMVGPKGRSGFKRDDADSQCHRPPGTDPIPSCFSIGGQRAQGL